MRARRLACAFVDDVEHAHETSLRFVDGALDRLLLERPVTGLCIWVVVQADTGAPLRRLALSLHAHGKEVDWITYEDAAVAPPPGAAGPGYTVDHIFALPAALTCRPCTFDVHAHDERGRIGSARLSLEAPLPF